MKYLTCASCRHHHTESGQGTCRVEPPKIQQVASLAFVVFMSQMVKDPLDALSRPEQILNLVLFAGMFPPADSDSAACGCWSDNGEVLH